MSFLYVSPLGYKGNSMQVLNNVLRVFDYKDYYEIRYFPGLIRSGFQEVKKDEGFTYQALFIEPAGSVELQDVDNIKKETTDVDLEPASLKSQFVVSRAKKTVYDLAYLNRWDYFITITVSPQAKKVDRYSLCSCKKRLLQLFNNYKKRYFENFKYLLLPEQHDDGAWHFHGFLRLDQSHVVRNGHGYLDFPYLSEKIGFVSMDFIKNKEAAAKYCTKYMSKDLEVSVRACHEHMYYCSKGLERPYCIHQYCDVDLETLGISWDYSGESGYKCTKMTYDQFNRFLNHSIELNFSTDDLKVLPF